MIFLDEQIRAAVDAVGDPLLKHIVSRVTGYTREEIEQRVSELVQLGVLRQKEDPYDHDWCYPEGRTQWPKSTREESRESVI